MNKIRILFLFSLMGLCAQSFAQPITVLLAKTTGVSDTEARSMLDQINDLASNSDIDHLGGFVSASTTLSFPDVFTISCSSTSGPALVNCARSSLSDTRNSISADIVLVMVSQNIAGDCGAVDQDMINASTVGQANESNGYAVIEKVCFFDAFNGQVVASHEVGHLLSIEHVDGDPNNALPLGASPANHAMENIYDNATAVASAGDCLTGCEWSNFFSDKDKDFSSLPFDDAGNSSSSNAVDVVESLSWNAVSLYRTPAVAAVCAISFETCEDGYSQTRTSATWQGHTLVNVDIDIRRAGQPWSDVYIGSPTCPVISASGILKEIKALVTDSLGLTAECQDYIIDSCGGGQMF